MSKRSGSQIQADSRKAVEVAGTRVRGYKSKSAHHWTDRVGKTDGPWRPGKTASKRGGR